jgi:hypothetical protein
MRRWGMVVSVFYALIVVVLLIPAGVLLAKAGGSEGWPSLREFFGSVGDVYQQGIVWVFVGIVICGQALLLFLSVDTTQKRLKPRAHILWSATVTGLLLALLSFAGAFSLGSGVRGDKFLDILDHPPSNGYVILGACVLMWVLWGAVFYLVMRNSSDPITRAVAWLLRGSVLELLVAVPCHVMARRRDDCSAPVVTSFGITTGIAVMLLSFGPSVVFLYKKRMDGYSRRGNSPAS